MAHSDRKPASPARCGLRRCSFGWRHSWPLRGRGALRAGALKLIWRDQNLRSHTGDIFASGVVEPYFQHDRLDVALAPAHVALCCKVSFDALEEHFAAGACTAWELDLKHVTVADMVGVSFRNFGSHPG